MISRLFPTLKSGLSLNRFYSTAADKLNYYHILGVQPGATNLQIHQAYTAKSKVQNPDNNPSAFHRLSEAFVILINPTSRDAYDSLLKSRSYNSTYINTQQQIKTTTKGYLANRKQEANRTIRKRMNIDEFGRYKGGLPNFKHGPQSSVRGKALRSPGQLFTRQDMESVYDKFPEFNIVDPQIAQSFKNYQQKDRRNKSQTPTWIKLQVDYQFFTLKKFRIVYWPYIRIITFFCLILPIWIRFFDANSRLALQNQIRSKAGLALL